MAAQPKTFRERWFPKARFSWREPRSYRRVVEVQKRKHEKTWGRLRAALMGGGFMMGILAAGYFAAGSTRKTSPWYWEICICASLINAIVWGYVLPLWNYILDSEITVFDHGIRRSHGQDNVFWSFAMLRGYEWLPNKEFVTVVLWPWEGKPIFIGVPRKSPESGITTFLDARLHRLEASA